MQGLNIAIVGCGPCGLTATLLLHRTGHHVSLFERFDTPGPIGSGLMIQPTGMAVLAKLGLLDAVLTRGARVDRLFGKAGKRVVLDVHYSALRRRGAFDIGIHRATLFAILHEAVLQSGITVHSGRTLAGSALVGTKRTLHFVDGRASGPYDLVVDALGTRTPLGLNDDLQAGAPMAEAA